MGRGRSKVNFYVALLIILIGALLIAHPGLAEDATKPGDFKIDPPTLKCLGFRWFIEGDDNGNATVTVTYRKAGETPWKNALPMLRVNRERIDYASRARAWTCGNLFAGSILNLEPDSEYEVHFMLKDPDGGSAEKTARVKTRAVPKAAEVGRKLNVYPAGFRGKKETPAFDSIMAAYDAARPGDIILIHAGIYKGEYKLTKGGTEERPIVFRGAGDGEAILDGQDAYEIIFLGGGANNLFFENLTIHNAQKFGIRSKRGASGIVVRGCRIYNVSDAIRTESDKSTNWYIADNFITGQVKEWYPRIGIKGDPTGVNLYGRGHIVCYNRITRFWDTLAIYNYHRPNPSPDLHCFSIDFYNNDLSQAVDDGIETDYGVHNIRVWDNRITNCHVGLSTQPVYGGPCYLIGNAVYNVLGNLKLNNDPSGLHIYHNTCISPSRAFGCERGWQNATMRNNLLLGLKRYAVETGSPDPRTTLDHNGYRKTDDPERFIKWTADRAKTWTRYATLGDFYRGTGHERHGVMVDFDIFKNAPMPKEGKTYDPDSIDLTLIPGCVAVDAGVVLPTINEDYTGKAPDLGAYELGAPLPHYGPRED